MKNILLVTALITLKGVIVFSIYRNINVRKDPVEPVEEEVKEEVGYFMDTIIKKNVNGDSVCSNNIKDVEEDKLSVEEQIIKNLEVLYKENKIFHDILDKLDRDDFVRFALVVCYLKNHATDEDIGDICENQVLKYLNISSYLNLDDRKKKRKKCISELYEFLILDCNKKEIIIKRLTESDYLKKIFNDNIRLAQGRNYEDLVEKITEKYKDYEIILKEKILHPLDEFPDVFLTSLILYSIYYNI